MKSYKTPPRLASRERRGTAIKVLSATLASPESSRMVSVWFLTWLCALPIISAPAGPKCYWCVSGSSKSHQRLGSMADVKDKGSEQDWSALLSKTGLEAQARRTMFYGVPGWPCCSVWASMVWPMRHKTSSRAFSKNQLCFHLPKTSGELKWTHCPGLWQAHDSSVQNLEKIPS